MTCASPLLEHAGNCVHRYRELRVNECDVVACCSPKALHASSSPWDSVVQSLSQHITSNPTPPPPPTIAVLFLTNKFYKKVQTSVVDVPMWASVCVVFLGWLRCLPIHSACYCYRRCLQWQVRHTPLPAHHWQHHLTRPSGRALNTQPSLVLSHPYSSEVKLSPFVTSRGRRALQKKKWPAWFISLIPLVSGDGEYHGAQCSNWQIKSNEMSLQM